MREQAEKLFRAVGDVGDDLIERADQPVRPRKQVWVKWAALAACCALVIGAAAFVVPLFGAGSSGPETAAFTQAPAPAETAPAAQDMDLPETAQAAPEAAAQAPAEAEAPAGEKAPAEGTGWFAVVASSLTRTSADVTLTDPDGAILALHSEYWLERLENGEWQPLVTAQLQPQQQDQASAPEAAVCTLHYDWTERYGALPDGEYRLAQPVILADETEDTLYACFTVE